MKWFSFEGILGEVKKVRWPKKNELLKDTFVAIAFMLIFAIFFVMSDLVVSILLRLLGVLK